MRWRRWVMAPGFGTFGHVRRPRRADSVERVQGWVRHEGDGSACHQGRLLVATPLIGDPNFERTVVLLLLHGADGAFGLVLNRPSTVPVGHVVPDWEHGVAAPEVLFLGGPVDVERVVGIGMGTDADPAPDLEDGGFPILVGGYRAVDLNRPPSVLAPDPGARLFAGSAGWGPGQLEDEIAEGAWWPCDTRAEDIVTADPVGLWRRVLRRQPGEVAWFANCPEDPTVN